jgi:hypothetical protein
MRKREAPDAWRKSRTSLGTGSLSGRFIESLFRLKNPNQSLLMAQQLRELGDVGSDPPGLVAWGNAPSRFRNRSIRNSPVMEQCSVTTGFQYEQVLAFDQLRTRGDSRFVLCSKSAPCSSRAYPRISVRHPLSVGQTPSCRPCATATSPSESGE